VSTLQFISIRFDKLCRFDIIARHLYSCPALPMGDEDIPISSRICYTLP